MKITFNIKQIIIIVLCAILVSYYLVTRRQLRIAQDKISVMNTELLGLKDSIKVKEVLINGIKQKLFTSEALVVSSQEALKYSEAEREYYRKIHLKDLQLVSKLNIEIEILKKQGQYKPDTIWRSDTSVVIINKAEYHDKFTDISVVLDTVPLFSFKDNVPLRVNVGYKWFTPAVVVTTENRNANITKNTTVIVKKKFINRVYPYLIIGGAVGYILGK